MAGTTRVYRRGGVEMKTALDRSKAKVRRLRDQLAEGEGERARFRAHAAELIANYRGENRKLQQAIVDNNFELQELKDKQPVKRGRKKADPP